MQRRIMLSAVALAIGAGLLVAASLASPASSGTSGPAASAAGKARRGGTFRYSLATDIDYVDPGLAYYVPSWQILYATCRTLMQYPDAPAPRGGRLLPDGAASFPRVSRNGRVYTFTVRRGMRFSTGRPITAQNYAWAINRVLSKEMLSAGQPFYEQIVGAKAVTAGRARRASGIRVLGRNRIQFRLTQRRPDFLNILALLFACPMPTNTPLTSEGIQAPVPGSGPYYIREWVPNRRIVVARNRFYRGNRPRNINQFVYDVGLPLETIRLNIERNQTDFGDIPPTAHAELGRRYGRQGKTGPGRYHVNPSMSFDYFSLNHDRRMFGGRTNGGGPARSGNVRLKKAVNFAIDRRALLAQRGAYAGIVNDQSLPPQMFGFRNVSIYPARPNFNRASRLARGNTRGGRADFYCPNRAPAPQQCQLVQAYLKRIGVNADIKLFPRAVQFQKCQTRGEPFDICWSGWHADYFDPYDFLFLFDGRTIKPANNANDSYFNSPTFNRRIARAQSLTGQARYRSFGNLDVWLMRNAAPVASYLTRNDRYFFSNRVGCFVYQPVYTLDLARLCLK